MSIVLNGTTQYGYTTTVPANNEPFTISAWIKADSIAVSGVVASLNNGGTDIHILQAAGAITNDPIRVGTYKSSWTVTDTSAGYTTGTWIHVCGVWASDTSRSTFINGANKNTDTTNKALNTLNQLMVGAYNALSATGFFDGKVAQVAVWNMALSDAEVAQLAAGENPQSVQSGNLIDYWPLDTDATDSIRSNTLTLVGSPSFDGADNPNVSEMAYWRRILTEYMPSVTPTLGSILANDLTASRLVYADADKILASVTNLTSWIAGTENKIGISDDGDGSVTITVTDPLVTGSITVTGTIDASAGKILVEDSDTSEPSGESDGYVGVAVVAGNPRLYFTVGGNMYYVDGTLVAAAGAGTPIGLLLVWTHT